MEKATISKLKDNLSAYLRKVRAGHAVVIYDRDVPVARLERIESVGRGAHRLALLRAQGVTRPPTRPMSAEKLRASLAKPLGRASRLLEALRLDRLEEQSGVYAREVLGRLRHHSAACRGARSRGHARSPRGGRGHTGLVGNAGRDCRDHRET